ncbi:drug resistance transporter, EmrB/QacA subfamily [Prauserella aidingensis]|uniref:MFS transporter n=1 Tax=Prauserella aidingensis TaxID=387890 RepID=UPI0020A58708|nr:MFS transporter [Prauserella aidingensis]MCP2253547.1 drug resistance transporter, EmrB/QacA subfamily [Prauserella aidingensis]
MTESETVEAQSARTSTRDRTRWAALVVLCTGALMAIVDETIVNIALPVIRRDLGFTQSGLAWVTGTYLVAYAGLLLLSGRLGDLLGRKRVFVTGFVVFTASSAWCGAAWTAPVLVAGRFVQGLGAAMMTAVLLGMIVTLFTDTRERATAIGAFGFVQAAGGSIGTFVGGMVTEVASWHAVFFLNVPIGLIALGFAVRFLASERGPGLAAGADFTGAAIVTSALMVGIYTVITVEDVGWGSPHTIGFGALSLALLGAFAWRQRRAARPLLPPRLLRSRRTVVANVVTFLIAGAMFGFMIVSVLMLRGVLGYGARDAALAMLPAPVVIGTISLGLSARLIGRFGHRRMILVGLPLIAAGLLLLARVPHDAAYVVDVLPAMLLIGAGFGSALPAVMATGMADVAPDDSGTASGLFNAVLQFGGAIGLSVLTVVATTRTETLLTGGSGEREALLGGYAVAYAVAAVVVTAAFVTAAVVLRTGRTDGR